MAVHPCQFEVDPGLSELRADHGLKEDGTGDGFLSYSLRSSRQGQPFYAAEEALEAGSGRKGEAARLGGHDE